MSPTRLFSPRLAAGLAAVLAIVTFGPLGQAVNAQSQSAQAADQKADQKVESQRLDTKVDPSEPRVSLPPSLTGLRGMVHMPRYRTSGLLQPLTWVPSRSDVLLDESAGAEPDSRAGFRRAPFTGPRTRPVAGSSAGAETFASEPLSSGSSRTASGPTPGGAGAELDNPDPIVSMPPVLRGTRGEIKRAAYAYTATYDAPSQPTGYGDPESRGKTVYGTGGTGGEKGDPGTGLDPEGWTILKKSPDTRVIYVSSSEGSDLNNGLSESTPVKTIAKGKSLVRMGYPDWLLLKRGDEWEESLGYWDPYGRSETERMVIGAYGEGPRPLLKCGGEPGLRAAHDSLAHVIIADLDFWAHTREPGALAFDPATNNDGILILGAAVDVTIEGCALRLFHQAISAQAWEGKRPGPIRIRRNAIVDSYSTTTHSQGIFVMGGSGLLIEENVIDRNGWHPTIPGAERTQFNHNIYLSSRHDSPLEDVVIRGNIISNASALGIKIWAGAVRAVERTLVEDNLFYACVDGFRQHAEEGPGSVDATLRRNVFTELGGSLKGVPQSWGASIGTMERGVIEGNIFAHKNHDSTSFAIKLESNGQPYHDVLVARNIVYHWNRGVISVNSADLSQVRVEDNVLQDVDGIGLLQYRALGASGIEYSGNLYHSPQSPGQWFKVDGRLMDLEGWIVATGAEGESSGTRSFADAASSVSDYDSITGGVGTGANLVGRARRIERSDWKTALTGSAIAEYFRQGFTPTP